MTKQQKIANLEAQYSALTSKAPLKVKASIIAQIRALQA